MSVVQGPIRHGRTRDTGAEHLRCLEHQHERHVAAVAPAPYAKARGIHETLRSKPARSLHLIGHFDLAQSAVDRGLKGRAPKGAAAIVELENDVTGASQNLRE